MTGSESLIEFFRRTMENLPPPPRFDRCAVHDLRVFHSIPRRDPASIIGPDNLPLGLIGIPVVIDEDIEVGVIELRRGNEVVDRIVLAELRS